MGTISEASNFIDVICQHTSDGNIIPMRIRVKDEDGEYQSFTIKAYKELTHPGKYLSPYGTITHSNSWSFECKIQVLNTLKIVTLFYNSHDNLWRVTRIS